MIWNLHYLDVMVRGFECEIGSFRAGQETVTVMCENLDTNADVAVY